MSGKTYFITGGNRGIGLQLVRLYSSDPSNIVIASTRNLEKSDELTQLASSNPNVRVVQLDVSSQDSISKLSEQLDKVAPEGIDTFVSNAGISKTVTTRPILENTDWNSWIEHYTTNALGPVFITQAVYPHLLKKKTRVIVFISTGLASMNNFFPFTSSAYGQSKAALNHSSVSLSSELKDEGFIVIALHPGAVTTDMGNTASLFLRDNQPDLAQALSSISITPEFSGDSIVSVINGLTQEDNGKFLNYDGTESPY